VVRLAVLLGDAQAAQLVLEAVAAACTAWQPGGEDHAVAGHYRGSMVMSQGIAMTPNAHEGSEFVVAAGVGRARSHDQKALKNYRES
jgi:hypothetical protein